MDEGKRELRNLPATSGSSPCFKGKLDNLENGMGAMSDMGNLSKQEQMISESKEVEVILSQLIQKIDKEIKLRKELKCEAMIQLGGLKDLQRMAKKIEESIKAIGN